MWEMFWATRGSGASSCGLGPIIIFAFTLLKENKKNQDKLHQQIHDDLLQFSANTSQGPELTSARKKLKRNLFRAVSEGNVEELQRLLAELKERSRACTNLPVPGELCSHLGEGWCCLGEVSLFPKRGKYLYFLSLRNILISLWIWELPRRDVRQQTKVASVLKKRWTGWSDGLANSLCSSISIRFHP